jgi:hypothetical protein
MSKRKKQDHLKGGSTAPARPGNNVVDPKKRIKVSKEDVTRLKQYNQSIKIIEARLGTIRAEFLDEEEKGIRFRKVEKNKRALFIDDLKKKHNIIGNVIGADDEKNELILE